MPEQQREFQFTKTDFDFLRKISNDHTGILVPDDKFNMFYSRLSKRLRKLELTSFKEYCTYLENNSEQEFTEFINAVTTNLTSFFREKHHFDYLKETLIPELLQKNNSKKTIRVWSAGCSTGEEPYSIAMTLLENVPSDWDIKILATDLDTHVLETASTGIYSIDSVKGLDKSTLRCWFKKGKGLNNDKVKLNKECQSIIQFRHLNLMQDWPIKNIVDFIFCRNVLIYFNKETKKKLVARYSKLLTPGSRLFIGHSESLHQLKTDFKLIGKTIYKKEI
ncbi:MAG: protein-glutamate O-methyltransferase CheR [Methylococcales bacterium]